MIIISDSCVLEQLLTPTNVPYIFVFGLRVYNMDAWCSNPESKLMDGVYQMAKIIIIAILLLL